MNKTELNLKADVYSRNAFRTIPFDIREVRKLVKQAFIDGYKFAQTEKDYKQSTKAQEHGG